jgi:hypothetical protein
MEGERKHEADFRFRLGKCSSDMLRVTEKHMWRRQLDETFIVDIISEYMADRQL